MQYLSKHGGKYSMRPSGAERAAKSVKPAAYNGPPTNADISGEYLLIVNNTDTAIPTGDLTGLSAQIPVSRGRKADSPEGMHQIDYHKPFVQLPGGGGTPSAYSTNKSLVYKTGDLGIFFIEDNVNSGYVYPFIAEVKEVSEHAVVWTHAGYDEYEFMSYNFPEDGYTQDMFFDFLSQETNVLGTDQAKLIGREFDKNYSEMQSNFGDFFDVDTSGKVSLVCYDIQDGYTQEDGGYIAGFYFADDMFGFDSDMNLTGGINVKQLLHIDTYPTMSTDGSNNDFGNISRAYSTLFHELQHMINFSVGINSGGRTNTADPYYYYFSQAPFINEMLSMSAEQMLGYNQDSRILYYNEANPTTGFSLSEWKDDLMNYSLSYLLGQYLHAQTGGNAIFSDIVTSQYYGAEAIEEALNSNGGSLGGLPFSEVHTNYRSALALNEEAGLNSFAGSYVPESGLGLTQHLYTGNGPVEVLPFSSILIKLANPEVTVSVPAGLNYYGLGEPEIYRTLTFDSMGGTDVAPINLLTGTAAAKPDDPEKTDYHFEGWFVSIDEGITLADNPFDFTQVITENITLYAKWSEVPPDDVTPPSATEDRNQGGSNSGSSRKSSATSNASIANTSPAPQKQPAPPANAVTKVVSKPDQNGNVTATVPDQNITDAIKTAKKQAGQNGISITVDIRQNQAVNSTSMTISQTTLDNMISEGVKEFNVTSDITSVGFDLEALKAIPKSASGEITVTVARQDMTNLPADVKNAIGHHPAFHFTMSCAGQPVSSFGSGSALIQIPYTLLENEVVGNVQAVYVDADNKVNWLPASSYNADTKMLMFYTSHFSLYGVGYRQDAPKFTDISAHWAKDDIEFAAARSLISASADNQFSPNAGLTRGALATALGRLASVNANNYLLPVFSDVKTDAYYAPYITWAKTQGIMDGITATAFAPDQTVTRQEMAVIMTNFARVMKRSLPKTRTSESFADSAQIAGWAKDSVSTMQLAGIIIGKDGNLFDPAQKTTRAEFSSVLRRYVELVVNPATAQGFEVNDSGRALYYKNGKVLTAPQIENEKK